MVRILCIDDNPSRKADLRGTLQGTRGIYLVFLDPSAFGPTTINVLHPDIALIDLVLNQVLDDLGKKKFQWEGRVLASAIREVSPDTPVYGYSGELEKIEAYRRSETDSVLFEKFIVLTDLLKSQLKTVGADAKDYQRIVKRVPNSSRVVGLNAYVQLLAPPSCARRNLEELMLSDFLGRQPRGNRTAMDFARWIRGSFLELPGLLRPANYVAATLGLSEIGFIRVKPALRTAVFRGPFWGTTPRLWWSDEVERILVRRAGQRQVSSTGVLSRLADVAFDLKGTERVLCGVCEEPFPETVAVTKLGDEPLAVHIRCSTRHTRILDRSLFDQPREYAME